MLACLGNVVVVKSWKITIAWTTVFLEDTNVTVIFILQFGGVDS
jgi:hypothetical protein